MHVSRNELSWSGKLFTGKRRRRKISRKNFKIVTMGDSLLTFGSTNTKPEITQ